MRRKALLATCLLVGIGLFIATETAHDPAGERIFTMPTTDVATTESDTTAIEAARPQRMSGPDWQRRFLADWHEPYGAVLDANVQEAIWDEIERVPSEDSRAVNSWILVGPSGMETADGALYSGRVLDIEALDGLGTTIAAASGGLWQYIVLIPNPLTEKITSQWIGSVDVDPNDENIILVGTGEPRIYNGTGIWKSTDGGETWARKQTVGATFRVRFSADGTMAHATTTLGYYRSIDGGETWSRTYSGETGDLALTPNPAIAYMTVWDEGLYGTLNGGASWGKMTGTGLPTSDVTRGAIAVCDADPGVIYVAFARESGRQHVLKGVYKTTDYGASWSDVSPPVNYMGGSGWYNNVISVSPTNPDLVLAGGVSLWRSKDGGANWGQVTDPDLHVDYHAMQWHPDGERIWVGHDGGWSHSAERGMSNSWTSSGNYLPITQYVEIDAFGYDWDSAALCGGSQDNGISVTWDGGEYWFFRQGGDGGGIEYGPNVNDIYYASGLEDDGLLFHRYHSSDGGITTVDFSEGIHDSDSWYPKMRIDKWGVLFTHSGGWVYSRSSEDVTWHAEMSSPFTSPVYELTVSPASDYPVLYACTTTSDSGNRMYVKDGDDWNERSTLLATGVRVRKVIPHPTNSWQAYALMNGLGTPGGKIYITPDRGLSWWNFTGDLPNVPLSDLVVHPDNDGWMFVASEYGCYRTIDGGNHWERWNNGMPNAVMVTEFKTVDMRDQPDGGFHIVAATYGRSIWRRDISGEDPVAIAELAPSSLVAIRDAAPNPFNPTTTIQFDVAAEGLVRLEVYGVDGSLVRTLLSERFAVGGHAVQWDGRDDERRPVASGVYVVRIEAGESVDTHKVVLAR